MQEPEVAVQAVETKSGLIVPADAVDQEVPDELMTDAERQAQADVVAARERVEAFNEMLAKLSPPDRLLRKLDMLLMQWLPQQEEWILLMNNDHAVRRTLEKAIGKAVAKRLTKIPYRR